MLVDPDGKIWLDPADKAMALKLLNARIRQLQLWAKMQMSNMNDDIEIMNMESDVGEKIGLLEQGIGAVKMLDKDKKHYYRFEKIDDNFSRVRFGADGMVYIQGSDFGFQLHEVIHVMQSLNNKGLKFGKDNFLKNAYAPEKGEKKVYTEQDYFNVSEMEVEAYKVQYAYNGYFPLSNVTLNEINVHTIGAIMNGGKYVYEAINEYSRYLQNKQKYGN